MGGCHGPPQVSQQLRGWSGGWHGLLLWLPGLLVGVDLPGVLEQGALSSSQAGTKGNITSTDRSVLKHRSQTYLASCKNGQLGSD